MSFACVQQKHLWSSGYDVSHTRWRSPVRSWPGVLSIAESEKQGEAPGQARLGRQSEASQSSSIMGSRDAGPAYGTKKNLILAGLEPAIFDSEDQRLIH